MIVVCARCDEKIYDCVAIGTGCSGDRARPEDFVPLIEGTDAPKAGDEMVCPVCGEFYGEPAGDDGGVVLKLEGDLWWPHPPVRRLTPSRDRDQHR